MQIYLEVTQLLVSVLLIGAILLQVKGAGASLFGSAEGGFRTRRGVERTIFRFTIILSVVFILLGIASFRIS